MLEISLSIGIVFCQFLIFFLFKNIAPKNSANEIFIVMFFVGMVIRLIFGLIMLFIVLKYIQLNIVLFVFSTMILYIFFLYFEIKLILKG